MAFENRAEKSMGKIIDSRLAYLEEQYVCPKRMYGIPRGRSSIGYVLARVNFVEEDECHVKSRSLLY